MIWALAVVNQSGGGFYRSFNVPVIEIDNQRGGYKLQVQKGYTADIDGYTVNIQKRGSSYFANIYGAIASQPVFSLEEAKQSAKEAIQKAISNPKSSLNFQKALYEEIKRRGGHMTIQQITDFKTAWRR